jgi:hypothetical protein
MTWPWVALILTAAPVGAVVGVALWVRHTRRNGG